MGGMWTEAELEDDDALVRWVLQRAAAAPDIYLRRFAGAPTAATLLEAELGIDSIGRIGLFYELADALGAPPEDDDEERGVAAWQTLGDVVAFVRRSARSR
jgi:acyl carrier protein